MALEINSTDDELRLPTSTRAVPPPPDVIMSTQSADTSSSGAVAYVGPGTVTADFHGAPAVRRVAPPEAVTVTSSHEVALAETKPVDAAQVETKPVTTKRTRTDTK